MKKEPFKVGDIVKVASHKECGPATPFHGSFGMVTEKDRRSRYVYYFREQKSCHCYASGLAPLTKTARLPHTKYMVHVIPKRSGFRYVFEPDRELKEEQRDILRWLKLYRVTAGPYMHGFMLGRSIVTNALPHTGKGIVIRMDIESFFPSVRIANVRRALIREGLNQNQAEYIVKTCTLAGRLPQGAPTSPLLANLAVKKMDRILNDLIKRRYGEEASYTRYADDLCFSSNDPNMNQVIPQVIKAVQDFGYNISTRKTRIMRKNHRQIVAGVVINEKPNISRTYRRKLRAELHNWKMKVMNGGNMPETEKRRINGKISHVGNLSKYHGALFRKDMKEIERRTT